MCSDWFFDSPKPEAEARGDTTSAAIGRLKRGQVHAVFLTTLAPTRELQQLAVSPGIRLIPVSERAMARLLELRPGLAPLTLPANTYPQQQAPVPTVAATALLVTTAEAPEAEVAAVADLVFKRMPQNERRGVTIPLHSGVARRFSSIPRE